MKDFQLVSHTIEEITEDLAVLRQYQDPYNYLKDISAGLWRDLTTNPSVQAGDLVIILFLDGDAVVGRLGMWASEVAVGGVRSRTYWLSDFVLHEDYRSTGGGGMMLLKAINHSSSLVAAGAIPPAVQELYVAVGFKELGPLRRYVYFYTPKVIFKTFLRIPFLPFALSIFAAGPLRAYYWLRRKSQKTSLEFRPVESFSDNINDLSRDGNYFPNSSHRLNWILTYRDNLFGVEVYRNEQICGYCFYRTGLADAQSEPRRLPEMKVGTLLDFYIEGASLQDKMALIDYSVRFFKPKQMEIFECQVKDEELIAVCSARGLVQVGGFRVLFRPDPTQRWTDGDSWHITQGEGDVLRN